MIRSNYFCNNLIDIDLPGVGIFKRSECETKLFVCERMGDIVFELADLLGIFDIVN